MRKKMNLMIGDSTAEKIKKEIGTAIPSTNNTFLMKGRDIRSGTPKEIELTEKDACEALMPILNQILGIILNIPSFSTPIKMYPAGLTFTSLTLPISLATFSL